MATTPYGLVHSISCRETMLASGAITQCRFVGYGGAQATVLGQICFGIAEMDALSGQDFPVAVSGIAIVQAGAAIAIGDAITTSATGKAVVAAATQQILGRAMSAASADGEFIRISLDKEGAA